jgi:FixJ family two-component response regulator
MQRGPLHRWAAKGQNVAGPILISVIDDDDSLRAALVGLVRSLGYEVRGFGSAEEFLQADAVRTANCIITDIQMPGMSGIELKRHLTAQQVPAPVIMITARPEADLEAKALASGAFCFLRKPFDASVLIDWVGKALELGAEPATDGA